LTIATMPALIGLGRVGHASKTICKSSLAGIGGQTATDAFAAPASDIRSFPVETSRSRSGSTPFTHFPNEPVSRDAGSDSYSDVLTMDSIILCRAGVNRGQARISCRSRSSDSASLPAAVVAFVVAFGMLRPEEAGFCGRFWAAPASCRSGGCGFEPHARWWQLV